MRKAAMSLLLMVLAVVGCRTNPPPTATLLYPLPTTPVPTAATPQSPIPTAAPTDTPAPTATRVAVPFSGLHEVGTFDLGLPARNSYRPRALAYLPGPDRVYVRTQSGDADPRGLITAFDAATGSIVAVADVGDDWASFSGSDAGAGGLLVDPVHNLVIALDARNHSAAVLHGLTLQRIRTLENVWGMAVDPEKGDWYIASPASIRVYDGGTMELLRETDYQAGRWRLAGLAMEYAAPRLYVVGRGRAEWTLTALNAPDLTVLYRVSLPAEPTAVLPQAITGRVYVVERAGGKDALQVYDANLGVLASPQLGEGSSRVKSLYLVPGTAALLVGDYENGHGRIYVPDPPAGPVAYKLELPFSPDAMTVDTSRDQLWISHTTEDCLSVVDLETWQVVATHPTAAGLADVAVDPVRGHVYASYAKGPLIVFDGRSGQRLARLPGQGRIAIDAPHGRFYAASPGGKVLNVFDADTLKQTGTLYAPGVPIADPYPDDLYVLNNGLYVASPSSLTVTGAVDSTLPNSGEPGSPAPVDAVVDPASGRIFVAMTYQAPGILAYPDSALFVYRPDASHPGNYTKLAVLPLGRPIYVDVDPATGWAYVSTPTSTCLLVDGRILKRCQVLYGGPLRVDPVLGHVYITPQGAGSTQVLVLDATTLEVLGSVPLKFGFTLRALDTQRHLLYLANDDGQIEIWSEN